MPHAGQVKVICVGWVMTILHPLAIVVIIIGVVVVVAAAAAESAVDLSSRDAVVVVDSTIDLLSSRESSKLVRLLMLDCNATSASVFGSSLLLFFDSIIVGSSIASPSPCR